MPLIYLVNKSVRKLMSFYFFSWDKIRSNLTFLGNKVDFKNYRTVGVPFVMVAKGGKCIIGKDFAMNNGIKGNPIGCYERCTMFIDKDAILKIGDNVGISQTALICHSKITIGNHVKIGGGTKIYDTDFHSLDPNLRNSKEDLKNKGKMPVSLKTMFL